MKKQNNSDVSSNTTKSQKTRETEERAVESSFRGVRKSTNQTILLVLFMSLGFSLLFFCGGNLRYEGYKDGTRPFFVNLLDALPNIVDAVFFVSISTFLVKTFMNIEMIRPIHDKEDNAPPTLPLRIAACLGWATCYGTIYTCVRPIYSIGEAIIFGLIVLLTWLISL